MEQQEYDFGLLAIGCSAVATEGMPGAWQEFRLAMDIKRQVIRRHSNTLGTRSYRAVVQTPW